MLLLCLWMLEEYLIVDDAIKLTKCQPSSAMTLFSVKLCLYFMEVNTLLIRRLISQDHFILFERFLFFATLV